MRGFWTSLLLVMGCAEAAAPGPSATPPTYLGAAKSILDARCNGCHVLGGIAPFPLDTYANAKTHAKLAAEAVRSRRMPPWMPDPSCRNYQDERLLDAAEIDTLIAWAEGGAPEGTVGAEAAAQQAAPVALPPPTVSLQALGGAYTPRTDRPDDYRCFALDHTFDRETYLTRSKVTPGVRKQVHHVLLFLVGPQYAPEVDRVDAADPGPGYTCFGGPGVGVPETIGAWVPGNAPIATPADAGIRIPKGARIVMQLHYNTLSGAPEPDASTVELWLDETPPANLVTVKPLAHLGLRVPAGDAASIQTRIYTNRDPTPWRIIGVAPHMHVLGRRVQVRAISATETQCLVDIPRWDFGWQQSYRFLPGEEVTIAPGDSIRVDCTYDNSAANQAVVNGVKLEPREVTWGEGTLDEMCLAYIFLVAPFTPSEARTAEDTCPGFQACYDACRQQPSKIAMGCALECSRAAAPGRQCSQCVVSSVVACTIDECVQPIDGFVQCLDACAAEGSSSDCVARMCPQSILALDQCAAPRINSGACDAMTAGCGADL